MPACNGGGGGLYPRHGPPQPPPRPRRLPLSPCLRRPPSTSAPSTPTCRAAQRPGPLPPDQPQRLDPDRHLLPAEARPHPLRVRQPEGRDGHRRRQPGSGSSTPSRTATRPAIRSTRRRSALLLRDRLSLTEPGLVLGATQDAGGIDITVVDPRAPQAGRMVMTFAADPIALSSGRSPPRPARAPGSSSSDLTTGIGARPEPLQHRARRRQLPLTAEVRERLLEGSGPT